jgi:hypothetical protein
MYLTKNPAKITEFIGFETGLILGLEVWAFMLW